jgi:hypothetical protein
MRSILPVPSGHPRSPDRGQNLARRSLRFHHQCRIVHELIERATPRSDLHLLRWPGCWGLLTISPNQRRVALRASRAGLFARVVAVSQAQLPRKAPRLHRFPHHPPATWSGPLTCWILLIENRNSIHPQSYLPRSSVQSAFPAFPPPNLF